MAVYMVAILVIGIAFAHRNKTLLPDQLITRSGGILGGSGIGKPGAVPIGPPANY